MPTETTYERVEEQIKNKQLRYFNFYNSDVNAIVQRNTKYYEKHPHDVISLNQVVNKLYLDIEVFTNNEGLDSDAIDNGTYPINIVTIRNSTDLILHTYVLLFPNNMAQFGIVQGMTNDTYNQFIFDTEQWLVNELKNRTYIGTEFVEANYSVELHLYTDEKQLLLDLWNKIHEYDPDILTSWNGDNFDYYYMYNRCSTLFGEENVSKLMSKFNKVEVRNKRVVFFEYTVADLLYLYKPRSEGGLSYGSTQPFYALDFIAEVELEKKKVSYKEENLSLDDFYLKNPREATLYNIVDVILIIGLDNKNKTIDLNNTIRRAMKTPFHSSIIGSSALYDAFVFSRLDFMGYKIRSNITTEGNLSFSKEWLQQFGTIKGNAKSKEIQACAISSKDFVKITKKFPGAYVKQPHPEIIDDDSMVIDLDATSMYPSNILQGNISFDCYVARILPPQCNSTLKLLFSCLGKGPFPSNLMANVQKMVTDYVVEKQISPKVENIQKFYYTTLGLFQKLANSQKTLDQICNPKTSEDSILLKTVLIPLLDIIFTVHPTSQSYNDFVYDFLYLVNKEDPNWQDNKSLIKQKYPEGLWIIYNPNESDISLSHITIDEAYAYIADHCLAFSGCLFTKHEQKTGLFVDMLNEFAVMRKHHKKLRDTYEEGSVDYKFENNNQNVFKRVMNTCYGLYGMSGFRYSDNWLARSITNNSLHALKVAMFKAEEFLTEYYKNH